MSGFSSSKSSMILSISSTFVGNVYCQYVISVLSESPDSPEQPVTNKSPAITAANKYFFMDKFLPFINFLLALFVWPRTNPKLFLRKWLHNLRFFIRFFCNLLFQWQGYQL